MRRFPTHPLSAVLIAAALAIPAPAAEPVTIELWPNGTPTQMRPKSPETEKLFQSFGGHKPPNRVTDVTNPTITVYPSGKPESPAVIVAPGGGFMFLSYQHEGTEVCEWLNSLGITAVLLKYRTPTRDEPEHYTLPVQDSQRAMGILRHRAHEWQIDPQRVGILGFSAGANLAGHAAWDRGERTYPQDPDLDDPRGPDFLVFIYGGGFLARDNPAGPVTFKAGFSVPKTAPPAIFICAHDDKQAPVEAAMLYLEYKKHAILVVEFAKTLEDEGRDRFAAAVEACRIRLRAILMTAFSFVLGVIPLLVATGAGAEMRRALGTTVFAGMLGVTLLGLFLTPVFYVLLRGLVAARSTSRT